MSLTKQSPEAQQAWCITPAGDDLEETLSDVAHVSRVLHSVENVDEIDAATLCDLCVCLYNAEKRLREALQTEGRGGTAVGG